MCKIANIVQKVSGVQLELKILIIEDEIRISNLLKIYLEREKFVVEVVDNGDVGLERSLEGNYDLILLDVFMPGKDGFMVLGELRKHKNTPVIMLSAQSGEYEQKRGLELGASGFIAKPFSPSAVVVKIKEMMSERKQSNL